LFQKAANKGDKDAEGWMGYMYEKGKGVDLDYKQAFDWYQKAADQGSRYAENRLGEMYQTGEGVAKNNELAVNWFRKAADQGNLDAIKKLKDLGLKTDINTTKIKKIMRIALIKVQDSTKEVGLVSVQYPVNVSYLAQVCLDLGCQTEVWDFCVEPFDEDYIKQKEVTS
jgi:TPR repeat protein